MAAKLLLVMRKPLGLDFMHIYIIIGNLNFVFRRG